MEGFQIVHGCTQSMAAAAAAGVGAGVCVCVYVCVPGRFFWSLDRQLSGSRHVTLGLATAAVVGR